MGYFIKLLRKGEQEFRDLGFRGICRNCSGVISEEQDYMLRIKGCEDDDQSPDEYLVHIICPEEVSVPTWTK